MVTRVLVMLVTVSVVVLVCVMLVLPEQVKVLISSTVTVERLWLEGQQPRQHGAALPVTRRKSRRSSVMNIILRKQIMDGIESESESGKGNGTDDYIPAAAAFNCPWCQSKLWMWA